MPLARRRVRPEKFFFTMSAARVTWRELLYSGVRWQLPAPLLETSERPDGLEIQDRPFMAGTAGCRRAKLDPACLLLIVSWKLMAHGKKGHARLKRSEWQPMQPSLEAAFSEIERRAPRSAYVTPERASGRGNGSENGSGKALIGR